MRRFRTLVLGATAVAFAMPAPATAQACDPLTFTFTAVGQGCVTGGPSRTPPGLQGRTIPGLRTCVLEYVFDQRGTVFPIPVGALLLGVRDPQIPLPFAPGCILYVQPQLLLPMSPDIGGLGSQSTSFAVPPLPSLVGATFFAQGVWLPSGALGLSNGLRTDIT